ncbi:MAG: 2-C-methyl-D-erythritol 4-phosphate cytidylyltransferase [Bacteroidales bacterium]|nr:2-C-methyl-D-erythritol 4-phosphate cytidylyltransferase [Bacteroidales bacterium]
MKKYVIVLACGKGSRMHNDVPKQYILVKSKPLLFHTLERIHGFNNQYSIITVINQEHTELFNDLKQRYALNVPVDVVYGGEERFFSVKNALDAVTDTDSLVAIHDGVRPFADKNMFENGFLTAESLGSAVCAVNATDSVRIIDGKSNFAVQRQRVFLMQTPQIFRTSLIKQAYNQPYKPQFTDDASVAESAGMKINIIEGNRNNIKVTYPIDLHIAEFLLNKTP